MKVFFLLRISIILPTTTVLKQFLKFCLLEPTSFLSLLCFSHIIQDLVFSVVINVEKCCKEG